MPNRLSGENSPYLLQHAGNPVDWYPWGPEALERARNEEKPIFLSIGYAACHWCHVMAHESFEDPRTAEIMNRHFINIKVDREERLDLDSIYMNAVVALTGQGGWPLSVFLTPDGHPFWGGTYFPPVRRYNMPSFREVLENIAAAWQKDRQQVIQSSHEIHRHLQSSELTAGGDSPTQAGLDEAALRLVQTYDWKYGGWGPAPKFPQPMAIEFLLRRAARGDRLALDVATHALDQMAKGGMYDLVGGGFARYSTDNFWLVPHFEKMLSDNAQLSRVYLQAYLLTGIEHYRRVCEDTLDFISRELMAPLEDDGRTRAGFFSSLDADSEGKEGTFYLWTSRQIQAALPSPSDVEFFEKAYGITGQGNFEGSNVLGRVLDDQILAEQYEMSEAQVVEWLDRLHARLFEIRSQRIRPNTDDKALVSWNALALQAFSEAARYLDRADYLEIARQNADFLLTELNPNERLYRSWRNGQVRHSAFLEDYAALILGLLSLYQSDPDPYWFSSALQLGEEMLLHFQDPRGGFFDTRDDQDALILRPKDIQDNAIPSGNSQAALALLQLAAYTGKGEWIDLARTSLAQILEPARRYPTAFSKWLCAIDAFTFPPLEVAILGDPGDSSAQELIAQVWRRFDPDVLLAVSTVPVPANSPALLHERALLNDQPTAFVCRRFTCRLPTSDPEQLAALLQDKTNDTGQ